MFVRTDSGKNITLKGIAIAPVLSLQSVRINSSEFDAPQANRFSGYRDPTLGQELFDITMAEVESIVQSHGVADDGRRESVTFISIHVPILPISAV
jgi:hypothetical protein